MIAVVFPQLWNTSIRNLQKQKKTRTHLHRIDCRVYFALFVPIVFYCGNIRMKTCRHPKHKTKRSEPKKWSYWHSDNRNDSTKTWNRTIRNLFRVTHRNNTPALMLSRYVACSFALCMCWIIIIIIKAQIKRQKEHYRIEK